MQDEVSLREDFLSKVIFANLLIYQGIITFARRATATRECPQEEQEVEEGEEQEEQAAEVQVRLQRQVLQKKVK